MGVRASKADGIRAGEVRRQQTGSAPDAVAIGSVRDPAEAEADAMAADALARAYSGEPTFTGAQVRRSAAGPIDGLEVDRASLHDAARGGSPLPGPTRANLERGFGRDLGEVRVHTGSAAAGLATDMQAKAFTHGSDIYFGANQFQPGSPAGEQVLAHEVAHVVQAGGSAARTPLRRDPTDAPPRPVRPRRRAIQVDDEMVKAAMLVGLDFAVTEMRTTAEQSISDIGALADAIASQHVTRFSNLFADELRESKAVSAALPGIAGFGKQGALTALKGNAVQKSAKAAGKKRDAGRKLLKTPKPGKTVDAKVQKQLNFVTRADTAMQKSEDARRDQLDQGTQSGTNSTTDDYALGLLQDKSNKRSIEKVKKVDTEKFNKDPSKFAGKNLDTAKDGTLFQRVRKDKDDSGTTNKRALKKYDKAQKKLAEESAELIALEVGKEMLSASAFFKDAIRDMSRKIEASTRAITNTERDAAFARITASMNEAINLSDATRQGLEAGKFQVADVHRASGLIGDKAANLGGEHGAVEQFKERTAATAGAAAEQLYESLRDPGVAAFEERFMQASRKGQGMLDQGVVPTGASADQKEFADFGQKLRDKLMNDVAHGGLSDVELEQKASKALELQLQEKTIKSAFKTLVKQAVPSADKAGTLGASQSVSAFVKIPLPPPGILNLEFQLMGTRYPDGNNWVQARVMIKGGAEVGTGTGFTVNALGGLGFYLEAGAREQEKLAMFLSFALYRRFVESAIIPIKMSDFLWGREAKEGEVGGKYLDKSEARHDRARKWGAMVADQFTDDDDYAESGGLITAEATASMNKPVGNQDVSFGGNAELQIGTRYDKNTIANQRKKHEDKHNAGKYKKGDAEMTGLGKQERGIGETNVRFTIGGSGSVGPFGASISATYYGYEKEWWFDGTVAATGGSFAGDPAAIAARVATWSGDLVALGGKVVAAGDDKRRKGQEPDHKDALMVKKIARLGTEAKGAIQGAVQGGWADQHAKWQTALDEARAEAQQNPEYLSNFTKPVSTAKKTWNEYSGPGVVPGVRNPLTGATTQIVPQGVNKVGGQLMSSTTAFIGQTLGLEKSKSLKLLVRGIVRPGEDRENEVQFHVLRSGSKEYSLFDLIGFGKSSEQPIFYASVPSGTVIWMGGTSVSQVKRAVRHEAEVAKKVHKLV